MNQADTAWMLMSTALVLLMTPALAFFYGGLVRSKNALNTIMMSFIALGFEPGPPRGLDHTALDRDRLVELSEFGQRHRRGLTQIDRLVAFEELFDQGPRTHAVSHAVVGGGRQQAGQSLREVLTVGMKRHRLGEPVASLPVAPEANERHPVAKACVRRLGVDPERLGVVLVAHLDVCPEPDQIG